MTRSFLMRIFALSLPLLLGACGLGDWMNANMPVIGQRCESWQCFTDSGQQESQINHDRRVAEENARAGGGSASAANTTPPPPPLAPSIPEEPTYQYVPRSPPPPGTSPFEGQFQPIE